MRMLNSYGTLFAVQEDEKESEPQLLRQSNLPNGSISPNISLSCGPKSINKICIGDKIKITTINKKTQKQLVDAKGVVMYIGYPYIGHGVRYGINLEKANGENNGSLMFDVESGKVAKKSRIKKYIKSKSITKRKFFNARKNHAIFVKKKDITCIDRLSALNTRFSIGDKVKVRYKSVGQIIFIGTLQHTKDMGVWYGIELTERIGRHDGTVNGVKYFVCPHQHGLLCRQSHLILIDDENIQNNQKLKPQPSQKWAKVLGATKPNVNSHNKRKSAINVLVAKQNLQKDHSESSEPFSCSFTKFNKMATLLNIIPNDVFRRTLQLPGCIYENSNIQNEIEEEHSFKRGKTTYILPNYHAKFKERNFSDYYDLNEFEDELGEGEFGVVYKCRKIEVKNEEPSLQKYTQMSSSQQFDAVSDSDSVEYTGNYSTDSAASYSDSDNDTQGIFYAVKKIKKAKFHHLAYNDKTNAIELLQREIKLLEKIQRLKRRKLNGSKFVIDLLDVFEDRNYLYIVTNFCSGGNLWQYIEQKAELYSEKKIQCIMKQILEGLMFLHNNNMAHLDIKPDNIMLNEHKEIQLIDFGMSRVIPPLTKANLFVGTPNFVAPEVIEGFYDMKADIWSVGVIFFMLRFGYPPFHDTKSLVGDYKALFEQIRKGFNPIVKPGLGAWFPTEVPVCDELKDLLSKMLDRDLANRLTAVECLAHPYFETLADCKKLPLTIMDAFNKFSGRCRFRVIIARLFADQIEPNNMKQLRRIWNKFDIDNDGSLTVEQFKKVMSEYEHGYKDYQIEAIFESLDWNETDTINFKSLLTAFSYQRLVAVDERLWEAFAKLDTDNDGHITKADVKRVLSNYSDAFSEETLLQMQPSVFIEDCIADVDWDDDGQVDYQEFLSSLHPMFNERNVTPILFQAPSLSLSQQQQMRSYFFQPSIATASHAI